MFKAIITILFAGFASMPCNAEFRDPTQPAYPPPTTATNDIVDNELVLSAIWISSHSRRATINGVSGKQGQTITIGPVSPLIPDLSNTATAGDKKDELPNKEIGQTNEGGSNNHAQHSAHRYVAPGIALPSASMQSSKTVAIPARSNTIRIISIKKNSVIIDQNGERKTLQLVQRPYKIQ